MTAPPVDPRFALESSQQSDLVQKKLSIDAMRKRVSGGASEETKLREACEGFESIFLQKMWEQMRKNVKKEGYLHSKDEEAYQSMFDVELAKKMASAGGIGLADMLYEQLGQKLASASKTTGAGSPRAPLPIPPATPPKPAPAVQAEADGGAPENLYSDMDGNTPAAAQTQNPLESALEELAASRAPSLDPANATYPMFDLQTGTPMNSVANRIKEEYAPKREIDATPLPERVSAPGKARPSGSLRNINRSARHARRKTAADQAAQQAARTMPANTGAAGRADAASTPAVTGGAPVTAPDDPPTNWPVRGDVISSYGRQTNEDGTSAWNTGMSFSAAAGSPVIAPASGTIAFAGEKDGVGQVVIAHAEGVTSHFSNVVTPHAAGDAVTSGMAFAQISSGNGLSDAATAGNLSRVYFEVRRGELAISPESLLA